MKRPLSITIIGIALMILSAIGVWAVWCSLEDFSGDEQFYSYLAPLAPFLFYLFCAYDGLGLLKLKNSARKSTLGLIYFAYAGCGIILLTFLFNPPPFTLFGHTPTGGFARLPGVALSAFFFALLFWAHRILINPATLALFKAEIMPYRHMTAEEFIELRTLATLSTLAEADALCAHLGGDGIKTFIPDQNYVTGRESAIGGIRVQVKAQDLPRAKSLMAEWENNA